MSRNACQYRPPTISIVGSVMLMKARLSAHPHSCLGCYPSGVDDHISLMGSGWGGGDAGKAKQ